MTKKDLIEGLGVSEETLDSIIKSCGYTDIKEFSETHKMVITSFIKRADIKQYPIVEKQSNILAIDDPKKSNNETKIVSDVIENVEVVTVVRKELIELISRAYHKGIEAGKNSILIADKNRLDEIFEEAINK